MNEQPKKKKHSLWWIWIILILAAYAGGIVTGPGRLTAAVSVHRGEMVLTDNVTIDVPADVTYTVESLSG